MVKPPEWLPAPSRKHVIFAKAVGAMTWFWIFYRAKQDLPVKLVKYCLQLQLRVSDILGNITDMIIILKAIELKIVLETEIKMCLSHQR